MKNLLRTLALGIASLAPSCTMAPSELPADRDLVVVKGVRIPARSWLPWYTRFADHLWIDMKGRDGWQRVEWNSRGAQARVRHLNPGPAISDQRWGMDVRVVGWFGGAEAQAMVAHIARITPTFPYRDGYLAWPGPNSNTFIAWLVRETPGMWVELPTTAVGKDYATVARVGLTTTRTGFDFETMLFGVEVGLRKGVEVQFLGLAAGIGFWPPSIKLPFLPAIPFDLARRGVVDK